MVEGDRQRFREMVTALAVNFRAVVTNAYFHLLWEGLADLEYPQVRAACLRAIKECEFMPPVARLRELAGRGPGVRPYHLPAAPPPKTLPEQRGWPQLHAVPRGGQSTAAELLDAMGASQAPRERQRG